MKNIKLTVAYDGSKYFGFQEQRGCNLPTIQEKLEDCLEVLTNHKIKVIGAGRTDSGVHAVGQVVNFNAMDWPIPIHKIPLAMNGRLPADIVVTSAQRVTDEFHARFSAISKTYKYQIYNARIPDPFLQRYTYFVPQPLNVQAMSLGGKFLVGEHDFNAFRAKGTSVKSTVRTIYGVQVQQKGNLIEILVTGNGFLYNMVRIIVGTLLKIGYEKQKPEYICDILASKDRTWAGSTVPPQGLFLISVDYAKI